MDTGLKNKIAIVTGGASGIGRATVIKLAEEGAIPIFIDKNTEKGVELNNYLNSITKENIFFHANLTYDDECESCIKNTIHSYGRLDILINNAGKNDRIDIDTASPDEFRKSLDRNLIHYYSMIHYSWPYLKESKGNVVFVGSKVALVGEGKTTAYAAAKGAINGMTRELATKSVNENLGIRINCVIPAIVHTPLYEEGLIEAFGTLEKGLKRFGSRVPLEGRATTPEEIANEIIYLVSDLASHVTGQLRIVDGGYVYSDGNIRVEF